MPLLNAWHELLGMPKYDEAWHRKDIRDEQDELDEAHGFIARWSEYSDVAYTYSRARWSGHRIPRPLRLAAYAYGLAYMFPKYTLRWLFFRTAGKRTDASVRLRAVRNPRKVKKLRGIAAENGLDEARFEQEAKKLLRYWPLLP